MRYFPVNLDLRGRRVVVVGGGKIGVRKILSVLEAGGEARVIDPKPMPEVLRLARKGKIALMKRNYRNGDLKGSFLAVAATDERETNLKIQKEARRERILLNVVDRPEFCDFVFPAQIRRGGFLVTVSTGGGSPALSKKVREELEGFFGPEYGVLVELLARLRDRLTGTARKEAGRRFTALVRSPILQYIKKGNQRGIDRLLRKYFGKEAS